MIDTIIAGRYRIVEKIGAGGMGTVFQGIDTQTHETVAIKQLKPEIARPDLIERFQREGEALRELNHPNMVKLLDTVQEDGNHYLILEYVSGGDLKSLLEQSEIPIEQILRISIEIADALTRAHHLNIIHRDLKPANILIAEDGTARLTDFGVAKNISKKGITDTDAIVGTVDYLAPEVFGDHDLDNRADIWAFGVMLFEMLTGNIPFKGKTYVSKIMSITTDAIPDLEALRPDAPIDLIDLIYRMLEKDPNARLTSVRHVGASLEDILHGRTTDMPPETRFASLIPDSFERPKHNLPAQTTEFVGRESELTELARLLEEPKMRLLSIVAAGGMGKTRLALQAAEQEIDNFEQGVFFVPLQALGSFDEQLVSVLQRFIKMLREGYSVLQCFEYVAEHAPEPTGAASRKLVAEVKSGRNFFEALTDMKQAVESKYFGRVVATMQEQFKEGGNLADRFDILEKQFREELGELRWSNKREYAEGLIFLAIADATGYQFQSDGREQKRQILDFLANKTMLLVIDNFEHLLDGAALMTDILNAAPNVKILATSRQRLSQSGETVFNLEGMEFPEWETPEDALEYAAVKLFMQSAKRVQPQFELTADNMDYIARICILVQGMPLGILLAASWLSMLSVEEIAEEISEGIDFLESDMSDLPERHRSIRAVFDYSWNLMNEAERDAFMKLSVFRSGFTREAAQAVVGANLRTLMSLMNKSLMRRDTESGRYDIHELLRQYGEAQLMTSPDDASELRDLHCTYYANFLHEREDDLGFGEKQEAIAIATDLDNIRIAWTRACQGVKAKEINKMSYAVHWCYILLNLDVELLNIAENAIRSLETAEPSEERDISLAKVLYLQSIPALRLGQIEIAKAAAKRSWQLFKTSEFHWKLEPRILLGIACVIQGDFAEAENLGEQMCQEYEADSRQNSSLVVSGLYLLAIANLNQGKYKKAQEYARQAYTHSFESGRRWFSAYVLNEWGHIARASGEYNEAKEHYQKAYDLHKYFNDAQGMGAVLNHLANIALLQGELSEAEGYFRQSVTLNRDMGNRGGIARSLEGLGNVMLKQGDYQQARQYLVEALHASGTQLVGFTLSGLVTIADLLLQTNHQQRAIEILACVLHHPSSNQESKDRVEQLVAKLSEDVDPPVWEKGKQLELETIVQQLLYEFGAES